MSCEDRNKGMENPLAHSSVHRRKSEVDERYKYRCQTYIFREANQLADKLANSTLIHGTTIICNSNQ